ncbi:MAG: aldo/keto reductase [Sedimentisphaerales bacterium]|nr:aldo/keto reductase [Sedimentisphaerales bacterium]
MMKNKPINRRDFLKTAAGIGIASAIASEKVLAALTDPNKPTQEKTLPQVPRRLLGRAKITVPALSFGAMFDIVENQIMLHKTLEWGVNYWDTAHSYAGGNSEIGIGMFLGKYPEKRKGIFLVTKASGAKNGEEIRDRLKTSLERMKTDYIDLYYGIHSLKDPDHLTESLGQLAADLKDKGLIKYFGFTTHRNMTECLNAAAKFDWIDAIMTSYNYRLMQDEKFMAAVDACRNRGIAIIAMKTQGHRSDMGSDNLLYERFLQKGFTDGQAKIKVTLADDRLASACVGMKNVATLTSNVAAVLDKTELSQADLDFMKTYAKQTCSGYCSACGACSKVTSDMPYVSDVMRSLMYHRKYGDKALARQVFADVRKHINAPVNSFDYSRAEKICPNRIPISSLMNQAQKILA